jgi:hypothetical protein
MAVGDLNSDGTEDVAGVNGRTNDNVFATTGDIVFGDGAGGLSNAVSYPIDSFGLASDLGDFDGDGHLDWLTSSYFGNWLLYHNDGLGNFTLNQTFGTNVEPNHDAASCAAAVDINNDGVLDMVLIDEETNQVVVLKNEQPGVDAPPTVTTTASALSYTEGNGPVAIDPNVTVGDPDNATLAGATVSITGNYAGSQDTLGFTNQNGISGNYANGVLTLSGTATLASYQAALRSVTYTNSSSDPSTLTRTVSFVVSDGVASSTAASRAITVTAVSAPPQLSAPTGPIAYTENGAPVVLAGTAMLTDSDSPDFSGGTLTVSFAAGGTAADRLAIRNQGTTKGKVGTSGANVTYSGVVIGTFSGGSGTTPLVVSFVGSVASPTAVQAVVRNITYANVSDNPATAPRTVRFVVTDGDGGTSAPLDITVNVTAVNDPPAIALGGSGSVNYTINGSPVVLAPAATVTDPDSPFFTGGKLTVSISSGGKATDRLAIQNQGTAAGQIGISGSNVTYGGIVIGAFTGGSGTTALVITFNSSASQAAVQALVQNVTYASVSPNPSKSRTVRFVVTDGSGGTSAAVSETINAVATGPAAVNSADAATWSGDYLAAAMTYGGGADDLLEAGNPGYEADSIARRMRSAAACG